MEMSDFGTTEKLAHDVILKGVLGSGILAATATRQ
jgi:hypothetical protein